MFYKFSLSLRLYNKNFGVNPNAVPSRLHSLPKNHYFDAE